MLETKAGYSQPDISIEFSLFRDAGGYNSIEIIYEALNLRKDRLIKELLQSFDANDDQAAAELLDELHHAIAIQEILFIALSDKTVELYKNWHQLYYGDAKAPSRDLKAEREKRTVDFTKTYRTSKSHEH